MLNPDTCMFLHVANILAGFVHSSNTHTNIALSANPAFVLLVVLRACQNGG